MVGAALGAIVAALTFFAGSGAVSPLVLIGCGAVGFVSGTALMLWLFWSRGTVLTDLGRLLADLWDQFGKITNR